MAGVEGTEDQVVADLERDGVCVVRGAFEAARVEAWRTRLLEKLAESGDYPVNEVGHQRYMLPFVLEQVFVQSDLLANPSILPALRRLLGEEMVLVGMGVVLAMPGAEEQELHYDHPRLFQSTGGPVVGLPPSAITLAVPLIDFTPLTGCTAFAAGSHLMEPQSVWHWELEPVWAPAGEAVIWDYRTLHQGTPNQSALVRPLLYMAYGRPWFRDVKNYGRVLPLQVRTAAFAQASTEVQELLRFAVQV